VPIKLIGRDYILAELEDVTVANKISGEETFPGAKLYVLLSYLTGEWLATYYLPANADPKTFDIYCPPQANESMAILCHDLDRTYPADIFDYVSLCPTEYGHSEVYDSLIFPKLLVSKFFGTKRQGTFANFDYTFTQQNLLHANPTIKSVARGADLDAEFKDVSDITIPRTSFVGLHEGVVVNDDDFALKFNQDVVAPDTIVYPPGEDIFPGYTCLSHIGYPHDDNEPNLVEFVSGNRLQGYSPRARHPYARNHWGQKLLGPISEFDRLNTGTTLAPSSLKSIVISGINPIQENINTYFALVFQARPDGSTYYKVEVNWYYNRLRIYNGTSYTETYFETYFDTARHIHLVLIPTSSGTRIYFYNKYYFNAKGLPASNLGEPLYFLSSEGGQVGDKNFRLGDMYVFDGEIDGGAEVDESVIRSVIEGFVPSEKFNIYTAKSGRVSESLDEKSAFDLGSQIEYDCFFPLSNHWANILENHGALQPDTVTSVTRSAINFTGNGAFYGENTVDVANNDIFCRFRPTHINAGTLQVIYKNGDATDGVALAFDASGDFVLYGAVSGTVTTATIANSNFVNGNVYVAKWDGTTLTIYDETLDVITSVTETVAMANGTLPESIGGVYDESPASGTASPGEYFQGDILDIDVAERGTGDIDFSIEPKIALELGETGYQLYGEVKSFDPSSGFVEIFAAMPEIVPGVTYQVRSYAKHDNKANFNFIGWGGSFAASQVWDKYFEPVDVDAPPFTSTITRSASWDNLMAQSLAGTLAEEKEIVLVPGFEGIPAIKVLIDESKIDEVALNMPVKLVLRSSEVSSLFAALTYDEDKQTRLEHVRDRIGVFQGTELLNTELLDWRRDAEDTITLMTKVPEIQLTEEQYLVILFGNDYKETASTLGITNKTGLTGSTEAQAVWNNNFKAVYNLYNSLYLGAGDTLTFIGPNGGAPDDRYWSISSPGALTIQDNKLRIDGNDNRYIESRFYMPSSEDFIVETPFEILTGPDANSWYYTLEVRNSSGETFTIDRLYAYTHKYLVSKDADGSYQNITLVNTSDFSGSFRISREGNTLKAWAYTNGDWSLLGSYTYDFGDIKFRIVGKVYNGTPTYSISVDNFQIISGNPKSDNLGYLDSTSNEIHLTPYGSLTDKEPGPDGLAFVAEDDDYLASDLTDFSDIETGYILSAYTAWGDNVLGSWSSCSIIGFAFGHPALGRHLNTNYYTISVGADALQSTTAINSTTELATVSFDGVDARLWLNDNLDPTVNQVTIADLSNVQLFLGGSILSGVHNSNQVMQHYFIYKDVSNIAAYQKFMTASVKGDLVSFIDGEDFGKELDGWKNSKPALFEIISEEAEPVYNFPLYFKIQSAEFIRELKRSHRITGTSLASYKFGFLRDGISDFRHPSFATGTGDLKKPKESFYFYPDGDRYGFKLDSSIREVLANTFLTVRLKFYVSAFQSQNHILVGSDRKYDEIQVGLNYNYYRIEIYSGYGNASYNNTLRSPNYVINARSINTLVYSRNLSTKHHILWLNGYRIAEGDFSYNVTAGTRSLYLGVPDGYDLDDHTQNVWDVGMSKTYIDKDEDAKKLDLFDSNFVSYKQDFSVLSILETFQDFPMHLNDSIDSIQVRRTENNQNVCVALSCNDLTYYIFKSSVWKAIVSKDDTIHGNTGVSTWHYLDSQNLWSELDDLENATMMALRVTTNRMTAAQTVALTDTNLASRPNASSGQINFVVGLMTTRNDELPEFESIGVNNKKYTLGEVIDLAPYDGIIQGSKITWSYLGDMSAVSVYVILTGQTSWTEVSINGQEIPGITASMATTGKKLQVRIVQDLSIESNPTDVGVDVQIW
jgi:hypothetical protein